MNLRAAAGRPSRALTRNPGCPSGRPLPAPAATFLVLALLLAGCAGTRHDASHPLVAGSAAEPAAKVYFIRPFTDRYMGFADNVIRVEAERAELMRVVKGEYTLVSLRPGTVRLTVGNDTNHGKEFLHKEMSRAYEFTFEPGQTYFLVLTPFDGEFRGVHFQIDAVDLPRAKALSRHLRVIGPARSQPIGRL